VVGAKCTIFEYRSTKNNNGIVTGLGSVKLSGEIHGHLGPSVGGNWKWLYRTRGDLIGEFDSLARITSRDIMGQ
jgi:hypothetical protein